MRADDQRVGLAAEAFSFGYPMVCAVRQIIRAAEEGIGPIRPVGFNAFAHQTDPPGPLSPFLNVNPDVLFSMAQVDLGPGPAVLRVPPAPGRYHVLAFYDPWLNVFAYLGTRTDTRTENGDGDGDGQGHEVLLVPPGGDADLDADADAGSGGRLVIEAPARVFSIVARFAFRGRQDLPAVRALQDQLAVSPLDPDARRPEGPPDRSKQVCDDLRFWEELRTWMRAFPPPPMEREYARRFEALGLLADPSPYIDPDPTLAWSLRTGLRTGRDELERLADAGRRTNLGWASTLHEADYNLDRFGPGVRDDRAWEIPDRAQARIARALAARRPLGIVHAYEETAAHCAVDLEGHHLTGAHDYRLRLRPPPVDSFWTLTMYDEPDGYLVDNPLGRYSISSLDDLVHEPDGSIPVLIQSEPPRPEALSQSSAAPSGPQGPSASALRPVSTPRSTSAAGAAGTANWLPAAGGDFRLVLRMYCPGEEVLRGAYSPPAIHRLD
ncbi:hypothetical protein CcI49_07540 [Frankia sp. CcI49]|uniref:DUF1254 domain-containing protein n=1 Tax=Frankia sp. CcI49 TaxID=1745382 RepID=UPI000976FAA7|nr:DUF1254 domain-containing protein [Frankia sp. CcI49]ONH60979.1 hypothetical protein CcI49_07540 [Frankia sp. CcI49]